MPILDTVDAWLCKKLPSKRGEVLYITFTGEHELSDILLIVTVVRLGRNWLWGSCSGVFIRKFIVEKLCHVVRESWSLTGKALIKKLISMCLGMGDIRLLLERDGSEQLVVVDKSGRVILRQESLVSTKVGHAYCIEFK